MLKIAAGSLFSSIAKDPDKFNDELNKSGIKEIPFILGEDWISGESTLVLRKGTPLWDNLTKFTTWIVNTDGNIGEPHIEATQEINHYLLGEITSHLGKIKDGIARSKRMGSIFSNNDKHVGGLIDCVGDIVEHCITSPDIITRFFSGIKNNRNNESNSVLAKGVLESFIAMFIYNDRSEVVQKKKLFEIAGGPILKDMDKILFPGRYSKKDEKYHSIVNSKISEKLKFPEFVSYYVRNHHLLNFTSEICGYNPQTQMYMEIFKIIDLFLRLTSQEVNLEENQVMIGLKNMADKGLLDKGYVDSLSTMYGGKKKSDYLSYGLELLNGCPLSVESSKRYIWTPKNPFAIICDSPNLECKYLSKGRWVNVHKSISHLDSRLGMVPPKNYKYCIELTKQMINGPKSIYDDKAIATITKIISEVT